MNKKIIVVDDESGIRELVKTFLEGYHFDVYGAENAKEFFEIYEKQRADLIILDLMLPDMHGIDICKQVREESQVPIIMLTASQGEMNTVLGFEAGADDYMEKPFSAHVLLSRVQAILRRSDLNISEAQRQEFPTKPYFKEAYFAQWVYIPKDNCIRHTTSNKHIFLTRNESLLLTLFIINHQSVLSREKIGEALNISMADMESRAIDVQISRLRNKLKDKSQNNLIKSIRNKGYLLSVPVRTHT